LRNGSSSSDLASRRLDQWLWFARFAKTRSLAARLCAAGTVVVNGASARKPNHAVRIGDSIAVPRGAFCHNIRVLALGTRRGPAHEARSLYEEIAEPSRLSRAGPGWTPLLLVENEAQSDKSVIAAHAPQQGPPQECITTGWRRS
jgi:ribosome-associated heat shock protein Hsp15